MSHAIEYCHNHPQYKAVLHSLERLCHQCDGAMPAPSSQNEDSCAANEAVVAQLLIGLQSVAVNLLNDGRVWEAKAVTRISQRVSDILNGLHKVAALGKSVGELNNGAAEQLSSAMQKAQEEPAI